MWGDIIFPLDYELSKTDEETLNVTLSSTIFMRYTFCKSSAELLWTSSTINLTHYVAACPHIHTSAQVMRMETKVTRTIVSGGLLCAVSRANANYPFTMRLAAWWSRNCTHSAGDACRRRHERRSAVASKLENRHRQRDVFTRLITAPVRWLRGKGGEVGVKAGARIRRQIRLIRNTVERSWLR